MICILRSFRLVCLVSLYNLLMIFVPVLVNFVVNMRVIPLIMNPVTTENELVLFDLKDVKLALCSAVNMNAAR